MRFSLCFLVFGAIFVFLVSCASNTSDSIKRLPATEYKAALAASNSAQLVDVRTADEFAQGALPGAINIDFYATDFKEQLRQLDTTQPVFVYCAVGGRSSKAASQCDELGFVTIFDLKGGYKAWVKQK
jgi:rhodanese-related sulfurtransferase